MICDYQSTGQACYRLEAPEQVTSASCNNETNPCDPSTGNKSQREVDYAPVASGVPNLIRFYNSKGVYKTGSGMPAGWRHTYSRALSEEPDRKPTAFVAASSADQSNVYYSVADACTSGWGDVKASVWSGNLSTATASFVGGNTCRISSAGSTVAYFRVRSDAGWIGFTPPATTRTVIRPNGASYQFEQNGSDWISTFNPALKLE